MLYSISQAIKKQLADENYPIRLYIFFKKEEGTRDGTVTGVQTCALPISCDHRTVWFSDRPRDARSRTARASCGMAHPEGRRPPRGTRAGPTESGFREARTTPTHRHRGATRPAARRTGSCSAQGEIGRASCRERG